MLDHPEAAPGYGSFSSQSELSPESESRIDQDGSIFSEQAAEDEIENYEQAQISIAKSLRHLVKAADRVLDLAESLRGFDGAKRIAAFGWAVRQAMEDQEVASEPKPAERHDLTAGEPLRERSDWTGE